MTATSSSPRDAVADACASLLVPGLGQLLQHRWAAGVILVLVSTALVVLALASATHSTADWIAVAAVTLVAVLDAVRGARQLSGHAG